MMQFRIELYSKDSDNKKITRHKNVSQGYALVAKKRLIVS